MEWKLHGVDGHGRRIVTPTDEAPALAIEHAGEQVDRVWGPPSVNLAEEKWAELEVSGVVLPPAQTVGSLIVNTQLVCSLKVDVVLEADCSQLVGNC